MSVVTFVTLTPQQRASHDRKASAWIETLKRQARDNSDAETRDNARTLLTTRGIGW